MKPSDFMFDYFLLPLFMVGACILIVASGYEDGFGLVDNLFVGFYFLVLGAFGSRVFYQKYYKIGRMKYFYIVFVAPVTVAAIVYVGGFILSKMK